MRKKFLSILVCVAIMSTACSSTTKTNKSSTNNVKTTTETTETSKEETTSQVKYSCFKDTDIPQCEEFLGVKDAFTVTGSWDDYLVDYLFISENSKELIESLGDEYADYDGYVVPKDAFTKYNDYLLNKGYKVDKEKRKDGYKYIYKKGDIKVTTSYNDDSFEIIVTNTKLSNTTLDLE